jgi:hypothetical protein
MYLDCVLLWPDDGCFTAKTCCLEFNCKVLSYYWLYTLCFWTVINICWLLQHNGVASIKKIWNKDGGRCMTMWVLTACWFEAVSWFKLICVIQHPPYLPDLALANFSLFLNVKLALKEGYFRNISDIQHCVTKPVKGVSLQETSCVDARLYKQSQHCVKSGGEFIYFFVISEGSLCNRYTAKHIKICGCILTTCGKNYMMEQHIF